MENNYLPLFRKYRPQSFKDIVGQPSLVKALSNAIELNRIVNAYLFCGPRGTGKTSSARIFAKSLNCESGPTLEPCQKCASCIDITNASGLDVIEIDAASNRGIQDAKDIISQVSYAPINGRYKIFIIDEVHQLSTDAFNALLKTFEEPPKNVIFILATTEPHKVLETVVSRCQRFDFRRITTSDIVKRLREISDIENIKITDEALYTIAKNVSGGMRDSLALLDQVSILGIKEEITKELIEEVLGKINFDTLLNLLKDILDSNIALSIEDVNKIYSKGNEPRNFVENFIEFLRNTILALDSNDTTQISDFTTLTKDDIDKIINLKLDNDEIIKILNVFIEYYKEIKISTNPYLWAELACIAACKMNLSKANNIQPNKINIQQANELKPIQNNIQTEKVTNENQKDELENQIQNSPEENIQNDDIKPIIKQESIAVESNNISISQNDSAEIWANILAAIPSIPTRAIFSQHAKLVGFEDNTLKLGFIYENNLINAKSPAKHTMLINTAQSLYPNISIELIKITQDTKVIDVDLKKNLKIQQQTNSYEKKIEETSIESKSSIMPENQDKKEEKTSTEKKYYSPKVQNLIEEFNGVIIE